MHGKMDSTQQVAEIVQCTVEDEKTHQQKDSQFVEMQEFDHSSQYPHLLPTAPRSAPNDFPCSLHEDAGQERFEELWEFEDVVEA